MFNTDKINSHNRAHCTCLRKYAKEFMRNDILNYQYANAVCVYAILNRI